VVAGGPKPVKPFAKKKVLCTKGQQERVKLQIIRLITRLGSVSETILWADDVAPWNARVFTEEWEGGPGGTGGNHNRALLEQTKKDRGEKGGRGVMGRGNSRH